MTKAKSPKRRITEQEAFDYLFGEAKRVDEFNHMAAEALIMHIRHLRGLLLLSEG